MSILGIAARWLFVLCIPVLLVTASQSWLVNSLWFYERGFRIHDASQATGLAEEELVRAARGLIDYFNSPSHISLLHDFLAARGLIEPIYGGERISLTVIKDGQPFGLFTEIEILHLRDVRILFRLGYYLLGGALAYIVIYSLVMLLWRRGGSWQILASGVFRGSLLTLGLVGALAIGAVFAFDQLFWLWHVPVFRWGFGNDYWILGWQHYLIKMFPGGFWLDGVILGTLAVVVAAVVLGGGAAYLNRRRRSKA
ncbi:MAG: DUF1461 domain-containing protein [Dehalococcoidia bacterium]|nr:hypothetical protein [Chloroflexota bacterium]MBT9160658.1 hypothetical protein [Chloroflexota bacterium]MBT9162540.1 hypothetical protein [Chloroflexota bacterium]